MARKSKNKNIDRRWSQRELASLLNTSPAAISRYINTGVLTPNALCEVWIRELHQHTSGRAAGREGNERISLHDERAKLAKAQTQKLNLEIKKFRGEFIALRSVDFWIIQNNLAVRSKILSIPHRVKSVFSSLPTRVYVEIDNLVREALTELGSHLYSRETLDRFHKINNEEFEKEVEAPTSPDNGATPPGATNRAAAKRSHRPRNETTE